MRFLVLIFTICALLITLPLSLIVFVIYRLASVAYTIKGFLKALNQYLLTQIIMEKIMTLVSCSERKTREFTNEQNQLRTIQWYDTVFTDGMDTIACETSDNVTRQIDSTDPNIQVAMRVGFPYALRVTFSVRNYEKDGKQSSFMRATINNIKKLI